MKFKSFMKKLNKSYSIVIIPNTNDSVRKVSLMAPFAKLLITAIIILLISASFFTYSYLKNKENTSNKVIEVSNVELEEKIAALTDTIRQQNQLLNSSNSQLEELKTENTKAKEKIQEFSKLYTDITKDYVTKTSRGSATNKESKATLLNLTQLSKLVKELNNYFSSDYLLSGQLQKTDSMLESCMAAIPDYVPAKGLISSPFGMRNHPIKKVYKPHEGVDISASKGDPIYAAASGVVEFSGYSQGYGYNVKIDHQNGFRTIYGHSSKLLVKKGEKVKKGQKIALVGSTGNSTGPHLHFEIRIGNTPVNPTEYVSLDTGK